MQKFFDFVAISLAMFICIATVAVGQPKALVSTDVRAPFSVDTQNNIEREKAIVDFAKSALNAGMPSLAKAILEDNFQRDATLEKSPTANETYIDTLIALGEFAKAKAPLKIVGYKSAQNKIRKALVECGLGETELSKSGLENFDEKSAPKNLRAWLHLAKGYTFFEKGKNQEALKEFELAKKLSKSPSTSVDAEVGINIAKLATATSNKDLAKLESDLKEKVAVYLGTNDGFRFAKQYAAVLFRLGKEKEALDAINQQLEISLAPEIDKDELNLISAAMTKDPEKQITILSNLLRQTASEKIAEFAIDLLATNKKVSAENFQKFLQEIFENTSTKIKDKILLEQAENAIKINDRASATIFAQRVIDEYPDSKYKADALQILAWSAWENNPPQYRLTATNLAKLAELQKDENAKNEIMYIAAACFFLDKDFATATNIYEQIFDKMPQRQGSILNKTIEAYLEQKNEEKALSILDKAHKNKSINEEELWNAEWKIISLYKANNETEKALERIDRAINSTSDGAPLLKMRMMWLRAIISERAKNYQRTIEYCNNIIDMEASEEIGNPTTAKEIAASTLLLKASCLEKIGSSIDKSESIKAYEKIRKGYPASEAAPLSYLYQARLEAELGHYASANRLCTALAEDEKYPQYKYAALFDAAQYTKKIATEASYKLALSLLDRLCSDFPDEPRNFYAKLSQAEILRLVNSFADARKLYNEIINKFEKHPEIYLAWLGLGDSTLAQNNRMSDAVSIFERLYSLPEMPIAAKAEAAFKWIFALEKSGRTREANEIAWLTANTIINNIGNDDSAKYWAGRILYNLAQSLEEQGLTRDARAAYELLVKYKLPSYKIAEEKIKLSTKK